VYVSINGLSPGTGQVIRVQVADAGHKGSGGKDCGSVAARFSDRQVGADDEEDDGGTGAGGRRGVTADVSSGGAEV
jgi:hypothetical protein